MSYTQGGYLSEQRILIINSCSKSKAISHPNQPTCNELVTKEQRENQKIKFKDILTQAGSLYTGQQALSIKRSVELLKLQHKVDYFIISAGFGFVKETETLPPYECSFSNLQKQQIQTMSQNLEIIKSLKEKIFGFYDLIYLALGKDYIRTLGDLGFLASKTSLLVYFVKELKNVNKSPFYLVEDSIIVKKLSTINDKVFKRPLGALIASKGTLLENYSIEITNNNMTINEFPFQKWIEEKIERINSLSEIHI